MSVHRKYCNGCKENAGLSVSQIHLPMFLTKHLSVFRQKSHSLNSL